MFAYSEVRVALSDALWVFQAEILYAVRWLFSKEFEHTADYFRYVKNKNIPLTMLYTLFHEQK